MSLYLLPNDFFGTSSLRPTSRCSFQHHPAQAQDSMDIDDLASFLLGGGGGVTQRDPFDAVIPHFHQQVSRFAHAQAQAQTQARRQREREQREREQREAEQREAARLRRRREVEAARLREVAYFAALMEQRQLELQLERQQQAKEQARRAEAKRVQAKRQKAYEAEIRKALLQRLEAQRQEELQQRRSLQEKKQEKEVLSLDEAMQHIFEEFFGGAFEKPRTQQATMKKGKAKESATMQHLPSVPEQNEPIDVDMVDAPASAPAAPVAASTPEAQAVEKPVESAAAPTTNAASNTDNKAAAATEHLLFKHAIPAPANFDISTLSLIVDPATQQVRISGLWPSPSTTTTTAATAARAASPTPSSHSRTSSGSASERRGRSPRRSRVADVDENGEEILTPDDDDDFVDLGATAPSDIKNKEDKKEQQQQQQQSQSIALDLPSDADVDSLRADLTDDGLDIYVKRSGAQL